MDKTTKNQVSTSFESPLWEELSDETAAACTGGATGDLKKYMKEIIINFLKTIWAGKQT